MRKISLTRGYSAVVDDEDYEYLSQRSWYAMLRPNTVYAYHNSTRMHRVIMGHPAGMTVHHRNGDGLDNRKCNLVVTTQRENIRMSRKRKNVTSCYKGVSWRDEIRKWHSRLCVSGEIILLGNFREEYDAAKAYNTAVLRYLGEGYPLNIIGGPD